MIKGTKIKGSDETPNFIVIDDKFYKVHPELVSFEFEMNVSDVIRCIGYSEHRRMLIIVYTDGRAALYDNISKTCWQERHNYERLTMFYTVEMMARQYAMVDWTIKYASPYEVMEYLDDLEYYRAITCGLWATDQRDKIIDPDGVLFQIQYP